MFESFACLINGRRRNMTNFVFAGEHTHTHTHTLHGTRPVSLLQFFFLNKEGQREQRSSGDETEMTFR